MQVFERSIIFWPVGTGDSTTIVLDKQTFLQVDLHHLECADDDDDPRVAILDRLIPLLPTVGGIPYLDLFVLTHPDEDHCRGFAELLRRAKIGELWFSPRIFREYKKDLCDDAKAFKKEAERRVKKVIANGGMVASGDRVRIIGYDELLQEEEFKGFPRELLTVPGNAVTMIDGQDWAHDFRAFIHAPFKDAANQDRNDTSIAMQVMLKKDGKYGYLLLLGDHCHPRLMRIFKYSKLDDKKYNVMLSPHHCSKSAMYWKNEGEADETFKKDIMDQMQAAAFTGAYIIASSDPIPETNKPGDDPPHAKAKRRYQEIVAGGHFICTQEYPDTKNPVPLVFVIGTTGFEPVKPAQVREAYTGLSAATYAARGGQAPPTERVGFGRCQ